jgi:predicted O-methyltransferase YrrM
MDFLSKDLTSYIESHTQEESPLLKKIDRYTHLKTLMPRMLSGHLQGRVLAMLSKMIQPLNVLEIGTFTGYSSLCMAEGLQEGGKIITIDINEELEPITRRFIDESKYKDQIEYIIADAREYVGTIASDLDLVFIDADKESYATYYDLVIDKVRHGGFIIADNVLWSGKVLDEDEINKDEDTKAIVEFNNKVHLDDRVENVLFPIRDGLMILRKT